MLKESREKIVPVEVPEWIQDAMLQEKAPWYARIPPHTWVLVGVGGLFLLSIFVFALIPFNAGKEQKALHTLAQESTHNQQQQEIGATPVNQPAQEGQRVRVYVTSSPQGATVSIDADSVGVTPLVSYLLKSDISVLSLEKPHFVARDTVLFLTDHARLHFSLRAAEPLPALDATDTAALGAPFRQPTTATLSKPVLSEAPTAARRASRDKTTLDTQQREPRHNAVHGTSDPLDAALPKTSADARATPPIETPQTETDRADDGTNTASETPLRALPPRAQVQVPADLHAIPTIEMPPIQTDHDDDETNTALEAHGASNSQHRTTSYPKRTPQTRVRGRGKKLTIMEVQGKRTLEIEEVGNLRVVTSADVVSPASFLWESENGVFAIGRSINIHFNQAGLYTLTVTARNEYGMDTETLTITVKEPPISKTPKEGG